MGVGGDHGAKVSAKGADWEDGGEEMKRVSRRGEEGVRGELYREGKAEEGGAIYGYDGSQERRKRGTCTKQAGMGGRFWQGPGVFLGGVEETYVKDTIECVFDGRSGESRVPSLRRTENTEVGDYGIGDEGESGQEPSTDRDGPGQVGQTVATKGRLPHSSKDAAPARHNAKASIERSEEPAAGAPKETRSELAGGEISSSPVSKYASLY